MAVGKFKEREERGLFMGILFLLKTACPAACPAAKKK
jgi:hypothetical protein